MIKWEYKIKVLANNSASYKEHERVLCICGEVGWELICITTNTFDILCYFKRPISKRVLVEGNLTRNIKTLR